MRHVLFALVLLAITSPAHAGFHQDPEGVVEPAPSQDDGFMGESGLNALPLEDKGNRTQSGNNLDAVIDAIREMVSSLVWASE